MEKWYPFHAIAKERTKNIEYNFPSIYRYLNLVQHQRIFFMAVGAIKGVLLVINTFSLFMFLLSGAKGKLFVKGTYLYSVY